MGSSHKKQGKIADNNAKKAKIFSKLVRLIQTEAKKSGGDTSSPGLKAAIEKARKENMPNDNIERAIKKGNEPGTDLQPVTFECYGPGGAGIIITALTDNNNRTNQEIKHILSKNGFTLAAPGSVSWNFEKNAEGEWVAKMKTEIFEDDKQKLKSLVEIIEDQDDVQDVFLSI